MSFTEVPLVSTTNNLSFRNGTVAKTDIEPKKEDEHAIKYDYQWIINGLSIDYQLPEIISSPHSSFYCSRISPKLLSL